MPPAFADESTPVNGISGARPRFAGLAQSADPKQQQYHHFFAEHLEAERSAASEPMFGVAPASALGPALRAFSGGANPTSRSRSGASSRSNAPPAGLPPDFPIPQAPVELSPTAPGHPRMFSSCRYPFDSKSPPPRAPKFLPPQTKARPADAQAHHRRNSNNEELARVIAPALWHSEDGEEGDEGLARSMSDAEEVAGPEDKVRQLYRQPRGSPTRLAAAPRRRSYDPHTRQSAPSVASEDGGGMGSSSRSVTDWVEEGVGSYREPLDSRRGSAAGEFHSNAGRLQKKSLTGELRPGKLQPLDRRATSHTGEGRAGLGTRRSLEQPRRTRDTPKGQRTSGTSPGESPAPGSGPKKQFQRSGSFGGASVASVASSNGKHKTRLGLQGGLHNGPTTSRVEEGEEKEEDGEEQESSGSQTGVNGGRKQMLSFDAAQQMALERAEGGQTAVKVSAEMGPGEAPKSQWGIAATDLRKKFSASVEEETEQAEVNVEDLTYRLECACDSGYLNITYNQWPEMPEQVATFMQNKASSLLTLNYEGNKTTSIPDVFSSMTRLVSLNLGANALRTLPPSLPSLINLGSLSLEKNKLETLPESVGQCTSLTYLDLSHNRLQWLPQTLCNLKQLLTIKITHNQLCHLPEQICEMTSLREINASHNVVTGVPLQIARLPQLELLRLNYNKLTAIPDTIGGLWRSLLELELDHNDISVLPVSLSACKKLEVLELGTNPMVLPPLEVVQEGTARVMEYLSSSSGVVAQDPRYGWMRTIEEGGAKRQNIASIVSRLTRTIERNRSKKKAEKAEEVPDPECGVCIKLMVEMQQRGEEVAALLEKLQEKEEQVEEVQRDCNEYRDTMLRKQNRLREVEDKLYSLTVDRDKERRRADDLEAELCAARSAVDAAEEAAARSGAGSEKLTRQVSELQSANSALEKRNAELEAALAAEKAASAESTAQLDAHARAAADAKTVGKAEHGAAAAREEALRAEIAQLKAALSGDDRESHHQKAATAHGRGAQGGMASKKHGSGAPTHTVMLNADAMFGANARGR